MNKILILQDLGIPREKFDELVVRTGISHEFIYSDGSNIADPREIVGIITIKVKVDESLLSRLRHVKCIAVAFTGYDAVDLVAARKRDITVCNVPTYATDCTAELAVGLAISLLREIPKGHETTMSGGWDLRPGKELAGKTVGIIGTGAIGLRAAAVFKAFKCELIGWSRTQRKEFTDFGGVYKEDLTDVFKEADIISLHLLLNESTKGIVGEEELSVMKKSAYLINVARGPIVKTDELVHALKNGSLAGAAVDVFDIEPIEQTNPLLTTPNVLLTPHIAYKTEESLLRRAEVTLQNIRAFIEGTPQNVISSSA